MPAAIETASHPALLTQISRENTLLNTASYSGATNGTEINGHNENGDSIKIQLQHTSSSPIVRKIKSALYSKYDQTIYLNASRIFNSLMHPPRDDGTFEAAQKRKVYEKRAGRDIPTINYESEATRRLTYELAYSSLKYQYILEDILDDVLFWVKYPELSPDAGLVYVVLSDYLSRKFIKREIHRGEKIYEHVQDVETCIIQSKVKLDAALARRRIRKSARCLEELLPSSFKVKDELSNKLLTYAWVNFNKTTLSETINCLQDDGYTALPESTQTVSDNYFCLDNLFDDALVFSSDQVTELSNHRSVLDGHLILQDKTSLFGPQAIISLLNRSEDIVVIDSNSGTTSAHLSSLMKKSAKSGTIYVFCSNPSQQEVTAITLQRLQSDNVKLVTEPLDSIELDDSRFKQVKLALIHAQCSRSAILDPVSFVITEGEDIRTLGELSIGKSTQETLNQKTSLNLQAIRACIRFPRLQAVVYVTRSVLEAENEKLVLKSTENYNSQPHNKHPYRVIPPVFNFDGKSAEKQEDKYYRHAPSEQANGCFVAVISREIDDGKENPAAVLSRAMALGLMPDKHSGDQDNGDSDPSELKDVKTKSKKSKSKRSTGKSKKSAKRTTSKPVAFGTTSNTITSAPK